MKISNDGISLIKKNEGCKLKAYKPVKTEKYWTIGYGHYGPDVKEGMVISNVQADLYLLTDLEKFEKKVEKYNSSYNWTQNEFDALVSFAYNTGNIDQLTANGIRSKTVIAQKMLEYNKSCGKVLDGLTKRRQEEHDLFVKGTKNMTRIQIFSKSKEGNKSICENFKVKEFACKDGSDSIKIDVDFVRTNLQDIRTHFGKQVIINSAYRTESYNKKVGGSTNSYHKQGRAFDIVVKGVNPSEVAKYASEIGVKGIIQYNTFVHVDSRDTKYWAINNNGVVKVVRCF